MVIFGIATTVDAIHRSLPHCTTSKLAIDSFTSAPSIHLLAKFVESLVLDEDLPFKLGSSVLKVLLETFTFHDLSVRHFLMALKVILGFLMALKVILATVTSNVCLEVYLKPFSFAFHESRK